MRSDALAGWRVVITRAEEQSAGMAQRLRDLGAEPLFFPTIAFAPPEENDALDRALLRLLRGGFDWLVLTSANAARFVQARLTQMQHSSEYRNLPSTVRVAAVGPATAAACESLLNIQPCIVPERFIAEALVDALGDVGGKRMLLLNADLARPTLEKRLRQAGAQVERVVTYRTVAATGGTNILPLLHRRQINAITFASGSAARFFAQRIGPEAIEQARQTVIVAIGPTTAEEARAVGLPPTVIATASTEEGMLTALVEYASRDA